MPRKLKPKSLKQSKLIAVRVTNSEFGEISRAASESSLPVASYSRVAVLRSSRMRLPTMLIS